MARLEGEKKSPLPLIVGLVLLAALAAGAYSLLSHRGNDNSTDNTGTTTTRPANMMGSNSSTDNSASNEASNNSGDNSASGNSATDNSALNSASDNSATNSAASSDNSATSNSAMSTNNSATGNSATSNSASESNSAATMNSAAGSTSTTNTTTASGTPQAVAERSKTIKKGDTSVTYSKKVLQGGATTHTKTVTTPGGAGATATSAP